MPDTAAFCPGCGRDDAVSLERAHGTVGMLPETLAGALAYFLLPAIVFLAGGALQQEPLSCVFIRFSVSERGWPAVVVGADAQDFGRSAVL